MKFATLFVNALQGTQKSISAHVQPGACPLEFSVSWKVLGPFQIGTRGMMHPPSLDASNTDTTT